MRISIASFSFHRLLNSGKQDMFKYITDCKELGATQLDPWNAHLAQIREADEVYRAGHDPAQARLTSADDAFLDRVRRAAGDAGLPFGCLAVDGVHLYEPDAEGLLVQRTLQDRWLDVAERLGAAQIRIDAGGPQDMPDDVFEVIVREYNDLVRRTRDRSIELLMENHWGPSVVPENVVKILDAVPGLGLLFDTNNWAEGRQQDGWRMCAKYARSVHFKTFSFDAQGNDPSVDIEKAIRLLVEAGYDGCWGVESVPKDGDEYGAVQKTIELIRRCVAKVQA